MGGVVCGCSLHTGLVAIRTMLLLLLLLLLLVVCMMLAPPSPLQ
jgi:hypothetical protein